MKHLHITFLLLLFSLGIAAQTQTVPVRYVLTTGKFTNDGRSWATAKDNVQDAINDVKDYMTRNNLKEGRVYVGAGVYTPTESTESGTGGVLTTSFKIPEGVSVYGGFAPNGKIYQPTGSAATKTTGKTVGSPQESPDDRLMRNGLTQAENEQLGGDHRTSSERVRAWDFDTQSQTYLSGNHADKAQITGYLDWKSTNKQYAEAFPGNSHHVVWFGTNGEIADSDPQKQQHYAPLKEPALLDGFVISGGSASTKAIDRRYHTSYGGGVYMVKGAAVRNCRITENAAARCGGAVYLDGGGELTNCYVFKNQAKGIGLTDGYGGGVFVEQEGTVRNCMLIENASSIGAGMMLNHDRTRYPQSNTGEAYFSNAFAPIAVGCVIVNNTATTEAGGIAMVSGGTANHLTVVRNHCAGNSVTINKRRYGRAGGLYIDIGAAVFNSVVWGNTNNTNSKTQYAAYAPTTSTAGEGVKPYLNFTAVANYDQTEWTGTSKIGVIGLNTENNRTASSNTAKDYYPEFAKVSDLVNGIAGIDGKGSEYNTEYVPTQISDLVGKGVALRDYITERSKEMINAVSDYDIYGNHLAPISTLGACLSKSVIEHITPAGDVANIENDGKTVKTIFVDPNFKAGADIATDNRGSSWDNPLVYLGDALHYIDDYLKDHSGEVFQVLVKEGTLSAANRQANSHHSESDQLRLRDLSLTVNTGVRIYGSFYSNLTGKNIKVSSKYARSPLLTPTYITGDITGLGYDDNVAHVVTLNGAVESVVDGFNIQGGNTTAAPQLNQPWKPNDANGAGIYISGGSGNKVRNCVISNCTTDKGQGAAVYASGSANLTFENIIINNNAASPANSTDKPATAMLTGGTGATFNHCLFRGNVGALTSDGGSTVTVKNTAFHANGTQALDGKNIEGGELAKGTIADKLLAVLATNSGSFGSCAANLIDDDLINQVSISGFSAILSHDPQSNANYLYPKFANPTTSVGVNQGGLVTYYGGNADFTPDNMNPMVNAANDADINSLFDITTTTPRSYGGAPDIGPIEDTHLPEMGTILYVQPSGSDSSNGLSWGNSFATVSKALTTASSSGGTVKEIWVAEGTYISNPTGDVHSQKYAYQMIQGVNVYGGFPATGTPGMNERNPKTHETILKAGVTSPEQMAASESTSYGRVLVQPSSFTTETVWNGFTITYGYLLSCYRQDIGGKLQTLNTENVGTTGGAGVYLMSGGVLENCRIKDNWVLVIPNKTGMTQTGSSGGGFHQAGAGIYNAGGTIRNCVIEGNVLQHNLVKSGSNYESAWLYGAGLFQDKGNVYNTIICKNEGRVKGTTTNFHQVVAGAGACLVEGQFYNNTIAGNKSTAQNCTSSGRTKILASGVYIFRKLDMYNCVIANNTEESPDYSGEIKKVPLLAVKDGTTKDVDASKINAHFCDIYKPDNTYNIYVSSSSSNNITSNPNLDASYRLQSGSPCINAGTENITGVTIPEQDADYTDRIKDCHIDIGAYEYNGASEIAYKEVTEDSKKKHVYFVTQNGKGFASAANPEDAACAQKLQLVLDAAGRHKYDLMNDGDTSNDNIEIVVRLAAFGIRNGATGYAPTHEVRYGENGQALRQYENPLAYSLVVPRGVVLEGGWCNAGKYEEPTVVVNSIRLNKTTLDLSKGGSETLAASLTPATASETETVTWSSSNPSVVTVAGGKVTAVGAGTATVSATCQGKTATCYVTVNSHITGITLNPSPAAVKPGATVTIKATLAPADHTDDPTITWKSNNTAVATVSADGVVTGVTEGEATIIATTSNGISATCVVKVSNFTITDSSIDLSIVNNVSQGTHTLKTAGASGTVTWSSDATGVATVSNSGVVTPVGFGVATITATNSGQTATCKVYVSETVNGVLMYNTYGNRYMYGSSTSAIALNTTVPTQPTETSYSTLADYKKYVWVEAGSTTLQNVGQSDGTTKRYVNRSNTTAQLSPTATTLTKGGDAAKGYTYSVSVQGMFSTTYYLRYNNVTTSVNFNTTDNRNLFKHTAVNFTLDAHKIKTSAQSMRSEDGQSAANASRARVAAQHSGAIQNSFADAGSADSTAMSRANAHAAKAKIVEYQDFQVRDPLRFQSIVTGQYSSAGTLTDVYHVITFTELVYDENHKPMLINAGDESKGYRRLVAANANADLKYGRAIIDGCFITGGKAIGDATDLIQQGITDGKSGYTLIDEYYSPANAGGAAIVPSYGHVRNCVVENNMAKTNGGALLLKPRALVSGCILLNNSAEGYGGAIYAYEPETANTASPLYIATHDYTADEYAQIDPSKDASRPSICAPRFRYANIFSSTIVGNSANAGGGVGFGTNLRMNSSVLWRNTANSEANINGELMVGKAEDETAPWEFPLQYCAVENERVPGYNNISVSSESSKGVRWNNSGTDEEILADKSFYYDLKKYSLLVRSGMLMNTYNTIRTDAKYFTTLEENDIAKTGRTAHQTNNYIEIGARVFDGDVIDEPNLMNLMKRIFVAIPEETDLSKAEVMQYNNHSDPLIQAYYAQSGSSMAYPMNRFDDALEYIQRVRKQAYTNFYKETATAEEKKAAQEIANTRFEIFLANGTHYPYRTVSGEFSSTRGNTFLIPENVCVYGGISSNDTYLSNLGYNSGDAGSIDISDGTSTITLKNKKTGDILTTREVYDVNKNSILEGWGLLNQSILSGEVVNSDENKKVYHVVTVIAAEKYVGLLPDAVETTSGDWKALNGTTFKEKGRPIILDGLQITGGEAFGYEGSVQSASTYYKGGAICVDGNWMTDKESKLDIHHETSLNSYIDPLSDKRSGFDLAKRSVGYRNIPLIIRNSLITNNLACMGGAVFTNGELEVYASQLSQNTARMNTDKGVDIPIHSETQITHHARGGAIDVSYKARLVNCIFANNSAVSTDGGITEINYVDESGAVHTDKTFKVPNGAGGFLAIGEHGTLQMMNCHVVRNLADGYPAIYNYAPNAGYKTLATASLSLNDNSIVNTVFWGNDYTNTNYPDEKFQFLMNPVSQWRYDGNKDASGKFLDTPESLWFCAYEPDTWYAPVSIAFSDLQGDPRRTPYEMGKFIPKQISDYVTTETEADRKNFNIHINADNAASDGPNFISPSTKAGVEGYVPSADWMVSRMNNLVDNGWTFMNQKITKTGTDFKVDFVERDGKKGYGIYYTVAGETNSTSEDGYIEMPTEETTYMAYADDPSRTMLRVSKDPNPSHEQCYIDIGAYEYPHVVLSPVLGSEVDVLWVSSKERQDVGVADGSTWEKATSDLQRAIETLLSSRNDHNKEIRLLDGDYVPRYTMGGNRAFIINTSALDGSSVVPDDVEPAVHTEGFGIRSLTIRGGYSSEIKGQYDIQQYQSLMHMERKEQLSNNNLDHVFIIEDARQRVKHDNNTTTETVPLGSVIPITIEGVTFSNNVATGAEGASAVWYKEQMKDASTPLGAPDVDKKLTLKNVVFTDCGKSGLPLPVVKIERGGDDALIYNSLWHSNHGNSLDAVKTKVINCTFARNDGKVKLDAASELHNSLLWMNSGNKTVTATSQCSAANEIDGAVTNYTYNAICGLTITDADNDDRDDVSFNSPLSINNRDVLTGPNFIDPEHGDYGVSSSVRVTSKASITAYMNAVYNPATPYTSETSAKAALENSITDNQKIFSSDFEGVHNQDFLKCHDLSTYVRLYDGGLERGAFEARTLLNRVMYLIASKSQTDTGLRWASAYGTSQLQDAINAGAVYYSANGKPAYIFARGSNNNSLGDIIMRDGVNLYGSLQIQFNDEAEQTYVEGTGYLDYTDEQVNDYVRKVLDDPDRAMAGSATQRTIIKGVTADAANMTGLLDCVEIANTEVGISKPVITVGEGVKAVVLRNCIIRDNNTAAGVRLAEFHGPSLLYNCLSRDNTGLIYFSNNAYSLHSTLTRRTDTGTTAVEGAAGEGAAGIAHFYNSIDFCGDFINTIAHMLRSPFAAYFQSRDTYYNAIMPDVFKENKNLWYQLHELSNNIAKSDMSKGETVTETGALTYSLLAEPLKPFVNYLLDRDLLGNPRSVGWTIKGTETEGYKVDYGCFETWSSNPRDTNTGILFPTRDKQYYNGNYYPHEGSVVYVNPNEILLLDNSVGNGFNSDHPFRPGYLLIRDGGAIYGQGSTIELSYIGVQKNMKNRHHLVSLPFRFLNAMAHPQTGAQSNIYATIGQVEYTKDSATGETTGKRIIALSTDGERPTHIPSDNFSADPLRIYNYNGEKRSDWKYKYVGEDSPCWEQIGLEDVKSASEGKGIAANKGWLMDFNSNSEKDRFIRFTAYGNSLLDWIYTEGDVNGVKTTPKKVELMQYDDRTSDAGGADFTHEYNMGWNLTGVPYLTTNYRAGRLLDNQDDDYGKYEYSLSAPHLGYALNASGSYEAKRSWEDVEGNAMNLSQGFFMQTATLDKTETLTYAVPRYNWTSTESKGKSMVSIHQQSRSTADDNLELHPDDESGSLNYSLGNDGVKFMAMNESLAQIYAIGTSSLRISLLSHAPVQTEIPVGLHIPADGSYTFAIPEDSDWEGRTVWLIDRETKQVVNLTHDSYTVNFTEADEVIGRFALKLGDGKPEIEQSVTASNNYRITAKDGKLTVSGLSEGDQVAVFTISGTKVDGAVAESSQWQTQVDANKVYVVVVNSGFAKKITAK